MSAARVGVIIVNFRVPGMTIDCLASLEPEAKKLGNCRTIVIDNNSGDDSPRLISQAIAERGWGEWVEFVPSPVNGGFAAGNNIGFKMLLEDGRHEPPDYVLLLNPDTIVREHALVEIVGFMDAHPKAGIGGSRLEDPDGTQHHSRFRFPTISGEFANYSRLRVVDLALRRSVVAPPLVDHDHPIDWVAGASMMVRRAVFEQIGYFDEKYFLYYEETDFCRRAKLGGWECWYVHKSRVAHIVGRSTGVTSRERRLHRRPAYWFDSRRRYFLKNHGMFYAMLVEAGTLAGLALWKARRIMLRKEPRDPEWFFLDLVRNSVLFRGLKGL